MKTSTKLVKLNLSVAQVKHSLSLVDHIIEEVGEASKNTALKMDIEFICYICNKIENEIDKPERTDDKVMSKMDYFWQIYEKLFGKLTDNEKDIIKGVIDFLVTNKHVKKIQISKVILFYLSKKFHL